jgi:putative transposase
MVLNFLEDSMPRKARIDAPGVLHHVIARGIGQRKIFDDDLDRKRFLERLGTILNETKTICYAWALIPNHFHLLLRTGKTPVATVMRRLLTSHAIFYNRRHKRWGHLFQNRYKSIACEDDPYFLELVRYIHLNPLRAGIAKGLEELDSYPFCGHSSVMRKHTQEWHDVKTILQSFGSKAISARRRYREFVSQGIEQGKRFDLIGGGLVRSMGGWEEVKKLQKEQMPMKGDERILGDSAFVNQILSEADEHFERRHYLKTMGVNLDMIAERVASIVGIDAHEVWSAGKHRKIVQARSILCYWAVRELGETMSSMARRLKLSVTAVSISVTRGEQLVRRDNLLFDEGEKVKC